MVKPITLFTASAGLNTSLDPQRLLAGTKDNPGLVEFSQAINVAIDDRGLVELRPGAAELQAGEFHSLFMEDGECFVIQERTTDAAIMQVASDFSLAGVRSLLTKNLKMAWMQVNDAVFYSNGAQRGVLRAGASYDWPSSTWTGPDSSETLSPAPLGLHMAHRNGVIGIAVGNTVCFNRVPFNYGLFNLTRDALMFQSRVLMIAAVEGGFFVSDEHATSFLRGDHPSNFVQVKVDKHPAVEWSLAHNMLDLADIMDDRTGYAAVWLNKDGVRIGMPDGTVMPFTEDKVPLPVSGVGPSGATLVTREKIIAAL